MKKILFPMLGIMTLSLLFVSCSGSGKDAVTNEVKTSEATSGSSDAGQSGVSDDVSAKNILQVAIGSKDHTTLVTAVKAAELADALANAGPFTVFAPTNAAFDKLPAGTVEDLLKPENKDKLADILEYHVSIGVFTEELLQDGQSIGQANSKSIKISKKGDKIMVNDKATVLGAVKASNGLVFVIDQVLTPTTP